MHDQDVLVAGETLIDLFPTSPGRLADIDQFERAAGGAPANVAVAMTRLADPPLLWTRLGDDPFGEHLADVLAEEGIPQEYVVADDERKTAHTLVAEDPDADQSFTFFKEETATFAMDPTTVEDATLDALDWVHVGGVMLCDEPARTAMLDLVERATHHGCTVSFDPNTRPDLWPHQGVLEEITERMLGQVDVVKTDRDDLSFLLEDPGNRDGVVEAIAAYGPHTVLLTRGGEGAYARSTSAAPWGEATVERDAFDVDVVETTGAGDAFTAGLIVGLRKTRSLGDAVTFASAVGALATTATGAMAALPSRSAVDELIGDT